MNLFCLSWVNLTSEQLNYRRPTWLTRGIIWPNYKYKTSSNQRLREWVRLVAFYLTSPETSVPKLSTRSWKPLSSLVRGRRSLENKLGFTDCFDWELLWNDFTMVNKFSAEEKCPWICADKVFQSVEQQIPNPAIITWLASTKAPKHVLTKGLKNLQIFSEESREKSCESLWVLRQKITLQILQESVRIIDVFSTALHPRYATFVCEWNSNCALSTNSKTFPKTRRK